MRFVDNRNITDPRINLALEEYLLRHVKTDDPLLLFYINEPSVIIGRNQNTLEEIDDDYVKENGVHVVRRLSGGGAVYHDLGNLNFSFIMNDNQDLRKFAKFVDPVVRILNELGVPAGLQNQSDIFVDGKKVSGNAQFSASGRMFSHGTILFDTNLENLLQSINPSKQKIESKAVQSIRNFVTNIREHLPKPVTMEQFKQALLRGIFSDSEIHTYELSDADWAKVNEISEARYQTWEWNIGGSPKFNIRKTERLSVGKVDMWLEVNKGVIQNITFFGDFSGKKPIDELCEQFVGVRYDSDGLQQFVDTLDLSLYFGEIDKDAFFALIY